MEYRQLSKEEYDDLAGRILYEDNHLLAVCKRVGEITQGDKTGDECLTEAYKAFIAQRDGKPGKVFLGLPHRLDRPVSGVCLLAKTSKALERLAAAFRDGEVHKTYWALCCERPDPPQGRLEGWLNRNDQQNTSYIVADGSAPKPARYPQAKLARLDYRYLRSTDRYHLVEVDLLTGRHHQIRCQLAHMGCPIKGDLKYGAPRSNPDGGICLHARNIRLVHPVKKTPMDLVADIPASWKGI